MTSALTISPQGLALIEGFESFRAQRYLCPAGRPTIGYGHVILGGESSRLWHATLTEIGAADLLRDDLEAVEIYLNATCARSGIEQCQFDALCSLAYNIGLGNFESSTLKKHFVARLIGMAAKEFVVWCKVHDPHTQALVVSQGLLHRRLKEQALFLGRSA